MQVDIDVVQRIPLFAPLKRDELIPIAAMTTVRHYERGETILQEEDIGGGLHYVQKGLVKVFKTSLEGREQVLRLIGEAIPSTMYRPLMVAPMRPAPRRWSPVMYILSAIPICVNSF